MTSIQDRGRPCRERTSKGSSPPLESIHDEIPVNSPAVELPVSKYIEENLQTIFRTIFEAWATSDGAHEKPLKPRSPDVYLRKSHMEFYNFCQQCEDHFATAIAKGPNCILFVASFLRNRINFYWQ